MFYNESKKAVINHIITGIIFSAILFGIIFVVRYSDSMQETVTQFEKQKNNYKKMSQAIVDLEMVMGQIDEMMPASYHSRGHREIILLAISDIKSNLRFAEVKIIDFKDEKKEILLPVEISFPVEDYTIMTESIAYIQSFKFPYFVFDDISVNRNKDSTEITCKIMGSMRMPVKRLKKPSGESE